MFKTLSNALKVKEIRNGLLFTLLILVVMIKIRMDKSQITHRELLLKVKSLKGYSNSFKGNQKCLKEFVIKL